MSTDIRDSIRQRKLDRMRLGQAVCSYILLPSSDDEIRVAIVPLTDAEAQNALMAASLIDVPDNIAGLMARDHVQRVEQLVFAIRDPQDLTQRLYRTGEELQDELTETDVTVLYDELVELTENSSPSLEGIPPEEFEQLKKVLQEMDWNGLSGRSWYAAKRFLGALIQQGLLRDNSPGFISNTKSITPSD